jgi:electron transfer DM13
LTGVVLRKPLTWVVVAFLLAAGGFGLYWFTPWKVFTSRTVNDALSSPAPAATGAATGTPSGAPVGAGPAVLLRGSLVSHEHPTSGTVRIVGYPDGTRRLEIVGLSTSDGPDLRVWLTDQPVGRDWKVFDDGAYLEVGRLKGNRGDQVYELPEGVDLRQYRSVTIWCKRFSVSFGAAELR